ncbi:MAG: hypothetical protein ATN36_08145 [Epulopiscium sp. Nele67-Bin005]|nr:MAG: hypothetical protein ATN36_08145 [Epulopiscium sp. Nele67-Bin005]
MKILKLLKEHFTTEDLFKGHFGIEREGLRCNIEGLLMDTPHPEVFGGKLVNPYITTDFAESQLEFITPAFDNIEDTHNFLEILYDITVLEIDDEYIWPQSMPCDLSNAKDIPIATFCNNAQGKQAYHYRKHLFEKYGGEKQLLSGMHYNFSFDEKLLKFLYKHSKAQNDYKDFKNQIYLRVTRNYLRYRWLIIYLFGSTSVLHKSFIKNHTNLFTEINDHAYSNNEIHSYRNSHWGYVNDVDLYPDYSTLDNYISSIIGFVRESLIESPKELYTQIRLKAHDNNNLLASLKQDGINYLEYRSLDINPFDKTGISKNDFYFMHIFNLYLILKEETINTKWQEEAQQNQYNISLNGQQNIDLIKDGTTIKKADWANQILDEIKQLNDYLELGKENIINEMIERVNDYTKTYAHKIIEQSKEKGYIQSHIELAKQYKQQAYDTRYLLKGYADMELSTQQLIKRSIKRGVKVDIIDRIENFVKLERDNHIEYVKQATKTSKDSYISMLIMENKIATKKVLEDNKINTPKGTHFNSLSEAKLGIKEFIHIPVVIKPKSTNFGLGINIFSKGTNEANLLKAIEIAFEHDKTVLIEEFITGKEYRILVVGQWLFVLFCFCGIFVLVFVRLFVLFLTIA